MKIKLMMFKMFRKPISNKGFTLNQIMATCGIAGVITLVGFNGFQHAIMTANDTAVQQEARRVHQLMEEIFTNQNPNEFPPQDTFPNGISNWVAPTNLSAAAELERIGRGWHDGNHGVTGYIYTNPSDQGYTMVVQTHDSNVKITPIGVIRSAGQVLDMTEQDDCQRTGDGECGGNHWNM